MLRPLWNSRNARSVTETQPVCQRRRPEARGLTS
jgi:hypothetical protein